MTIAYFKYRFKDTVKLLLFFFKNLILFPCHNCSVISWFLLNIS